MLDAQFPITYYRAIQDSFDQGKIKIYTQRKEPPHVIVRKTLASDFDEYYFLSTNKIEAVPPPLPTTTPNMSQILH